MPDRFQWCSRMVGLACFNFGAVFRPRWGGEVMTPLLGNLVSMAPERHAHLHETQVLWWTSVSCPGGTLTFSLSLFIASILAIKNSCLAFSKQLFCSKYSLRLFLMLHSQSPWSVLLPCSWGSSGARPWGVEFRSTGPHLTNCGTREESWNSSMLQFPHL